MVMKVLVAVGSPQTAKESVNYVMSFAKKLEAEVCVLNVKVPFDDHSNEDSLKVFAEAGIEQNVKVRRLFWKGDVISSILMAAQKEKVDMILLGASESHRAGHWVSAEVMKAASVPVLVMPHHRIHCLEDVA